MVAPSTSTTDQSSVNENKEKESPVTTEQTYTNLIQQYLAVYCLDNAVFYAERFFAAYPSNASLYLLALCYYRQSKPQRAKAVMEQHILGSGSPELLYLLAKCCFELLQYQAAEEALLRTARKDFQKTPSARDISTFILTTSPCPVPSGAAGLHLLGKVCHASNRKQRAIQYYKMSLTLDPMMWTSFEQLCELGEQDLDPTAIFGVAPSPAVEEQQEQDSSHHQHDTSSSVLHQTPAATSILLPSVAATPMSAMNRSAQQQHTPAPFMTPNLTPIPNEQSFAAAATVARARKVAFREYYEPSPESSFMLNKPRSLFLGGLNSSMASSAANTPANARNLFVETTNTTSACALNNSVASSSASMMMPPKFTEADKGIYSILELLCTLGMAQLHLGQFRSKKAIQIFERLTERHYHTGWVLHQVGRAYFYMADYGNAIRSLQKMEQLEPHRMAGLQDLSTALWQLKREVELSHLAQRVANFDKNAPEVWCIVGNCFSLQKEHETALTFFRRSIQLDPSFTYSHTLSGHEYFANEDFDKAIACYRDAIRADERHFSAWYGLGSVYHKQEKFDLAEYHFHRACTINPQSSVLICHLGMAQNANGKPYAALDSLRAAFVLDKHNPQAHYQRALVYQTMERHEEALQELTKVRDAAPREAQIHFAMGRLYKRMGNRERALRCFLDALDLDPKDTNLIKAAMEKMDDPDVEEEVSAF